MASDRWTLQMGPDLPLEGVLALYRAAGWWQEGEDPSAIPAILGGSVVVVSAWIGDELVGMGRALGDGTSDAYIQDVVVLPAHRGHGIGRALVARLRDECLARGIRWIALVAEPGTVPFYESLGFRPMEGHVPMRWRPSEDGGTTP